ncbi:hypothetical protein VTJ83DRAFT_3862 [Remersonia thermophila]|uniref:Uncharacterized protein n=1 Tax=Remersonia thermophila TaxID=72144 RepID=A0ABR4DGN6_9PEZI
MVACGQRKKIMGRDKANEMWKDEDSIWSRAIGKQTRVHLPGVPKPTIHTPTLKARSTASLTRPRIIDIPVEIVSVCLLPRYIHARALLPRYTGGFQQGNSSSREPAIPACAVMPRELTPIHTRYLLCTQDVLYCVVR